MSQKRQKIIRGSAHQTCAAVAFAHLAVRPVKPDAVATLLL